MGKSMKEYLGIDSFNERKDGTKMAHKEKYETIVNAIGLHSIVPYLPASKEVIQKALEEDQSLNNIELRKWDMSAMEIQPLFARIGITKTSLSDGVCVLKAAARMYAKK